jgi:hypothetical protein
MEWAEAIDRCAWTIDDLRDAIRESGHPKAKELMERLDSNAVQILASARTITRSVLWA